MNVSQFLRIDELKEQHNFVPEDTAFGMEHWTFVEDLLAPGVAMKYDGMTLDRTNAGPYRFGVAQGSSAIIGHVACTYYSDLLR